MSPQQKAQLAARLARIEAERKQRPLDSNFLVRQPGSFVESVPDPFPPKVRNAIDEATYETMTPGFNKTAYQREYMRKRRAAAKAGKP